MGVSMGVMYVGYWGVQVGQWGVRNGLLGGGVPGAWGGVWLWIRVWGCIWEQEGCVGVWVVMGVRSWDVRIQGGGWGMEMPISLPSPPFLCQAQAKLTESSQKLDVLRLALESGIVALPDGHPKACLVREELALGARQSPPSPHPPYSTLCKPAPLTGTPHLTPHYLLPPIRFPQYPPCQLHPIQLPSTLPCPHPPHRNSPSQGSTRVPCPSRTAPWGTTQH